MKILKVTHPNSRVEYINNLINEEIKIYKKPLNIRKIINEEINSLFETKQTEELAVNALTKNNIADIDNLLNQFKEIDKTESKLLLPGLAKAYIEHPNITDLRGVFDTISNGINKKQIKQFVASKKGYMIDDKRFKDWLELSGHIHHQQQQAQTDDEVTDVKIGGKRETPIWNNDKIEIYDGRDKNKCVSYGAGGITGENYGFCIGIQGGGMHQSYRDEKASTFWYVFDKTKELSDPLHMVVVDPIDPEWAKQQGNETGYELTDADNYSPPTKIAEFGSDVNGYLNYLKSQGVPVEQVLKNEPHSEEEKMTIALLKQKNPDLNWFKSLGELAHKEGLGTDQDANKLTFKLQSQYIGRGHQLSDEQFMYLWPNRKHAGAFRLLKQLVNTGLALPESQFNALVGQENG